MRPLSYTLIKEKYQTLLGDWNCGLQIHCQWLQGQACLFHLCEHAVACTSLTLIGALYFVARSLIVAVH